MSDAPDSNSHEEIVAAFLARQPSEDDYLRQIEALAQAVGRAAYDERGASSWLVEDAETPLQRAIAELSYRLRQVHYEGDGCVDDQ